MQVINQKQYDHLVLVIQKEVKELQTCGGWQCFADGKVKGFKKKSESNSMVFKTQIVVNIPLQKVVEFFMRDDAVEKINEDVLQNKLLHEKKGTYKIFHLQIKTPFPVDNRQAINMTTWVNQGNKFYLGVKSCEYPIKPTPGFVMANMNIGGCIFEKIDANKTKVTNITDMDPRGNIPDFVKNFITEKRLKSSNNLEEVIKKHIN